MAEFELNLNMEELEKRTSKDNRKKDALARFKRISRIG